ncbi:hypothetical protein AMAG_15799 [Allomyces macrogynus ATCC 38327]|uniref:Uncharacterized protein n=1 Tax=Allomyces macrogynus (strain ATCC 38327) TaxID=578462 RepID=A0A0L0T8T2_ALLM3|nr:hypothetical protein AMAG_15799 [Allomyces macrogynus ATCC 38327]|eukprot:KNE71130.1 hypothetical protein AMAG_15799 [Allomyces macrogynus ATCC 38327]
MGRHHHKSTTHAVSAVAHAPAANQTALKQQAQPVAKQATLPAANPAAAKSHTQKPLPPQPIRPAANAQTLKQLTLAKQAAAARPQPAQQQPAQFSGPPMPVGAQRAGNAHPDDAFTSGAWLFDASVAPAWLAAQLAARPARQQAQPQKQQPKQQPQHMTAAKMQAELRMMHNQLNAVQQKAHEYFRQPQQTRNATPRPAPRPTSATYAEAGTPMQAQLRAMHERMQKLQQASTPKTQPQQQQHTIAVIRPQRCTSAPKPSVQRKATGGQPMPIVSQRAVDAHPDDGFSSGAWLFDSSAAPAWLASQLPARMREHPVYPFSPTMQQAMKARQEQQTTGAAVHPQIQFAAAVRSQSSAPRVRCYAICPFSPTMKKAMLARHQRQSVTACLVSVARPQPPAPRVRQFVVRPFSPTMQNAMLARQLRQKPTARPPPATRTAPTQVLPTSRAADRFTGPPMPVGAQRAANAHPDDGFTSGAWLFDAPAAPTWLAPQLLAPVRQTSPQMKEVVKMREQLQAMQEHPEQFTQQTEHSSKRRHGPSSPRRSPSKYAKMACW